MAFSDATGTATHSSALSSLRVRPALCGVHGPAGSQFRHDTVAPPGPPTLQLLEELDNEQATSETPMGFGSSWNPFKLPQMLSKLVLAATAAASGAVATAGMWVVVYLLATQALAPAHLQYLRALPLDLAGTDLIAQVSMLHPAHAGDTPISVAPNAAAFLSPGQLVDVWVDLILPAPGTDNDAGGCKDGSGGMAHVVAEVLTADGRTAARATQPVVLRAKRWRLV